MWGDRIVTVVEIDIDYCGLTFGMGTCPASLGEINPRKCYNTFPTCKAKSAYSKTVKTLKFCESTYPIKNGNYIPALVSVGGREQEVNIAGFKSNIGALGTRASVNVVFNDFPDRDTLTDKYWAGRMDGTAQIDEPPYDPIERGSFWTKFKSRNTNYAGRELRVFHGVINDYGDFVPSYSRAYVMTELTGPGSSGSVTIVAKDILSLADNEKAQAPVTNQGRLLADISQTDTSLTLSPAGIGAREYPSNGYATIGSEIVRFVRAGDVLSLQRGQLGTDAAAHTANDTVQVAYHVFRSRADSVIRDLLVNYARIPSSYIDTAEWSKEFDRWGSSLILSATICKPTGVATLIGEINQLGITVWWDELARKIRIKLNHPPEDEVAEWSDRNNIISISQEDNDDERATRVAFWHIQIDPTKELNKDNFLRGYITVYVDGESPDFYGESRTKTIYSRWINHGSDSTAKIITGRLLNRYKTSPITYKVKVDAKDDASLADVVSLNSFASTDETGKPSPILTQVYYRKDDKTGNTVDVYLQRFQFDARYGRITENTRPKYNLSTDNQKKLGTYLVGSSLVFSDGRPAYQFV